MIKKNMLKKLLASILLATYLFTVISVPYARAQGSWYNQSFQEWISKVEESPDSEIFGERYTAAQVQWVIYGLFYFIMNGMTNGNTDALSCIMAGDISQCKDSLEKLEDSTPPLSQGSSSWQKVFTTRPISAITYFRNIGERLKIVPKASAQGFGFEAGEPILNLWKISRNITYLLLILVFVAIAFMIMFRVKISPQTVITVQSALPKIVLTLILITFSYAIAGLMIDLMYIVIGFISAIIVNSNISTFTWQQMFGALTSDRNAFQLISYYFVTFILGFTIAIFSGLGGFITAPLGILLFPLILVVAGIVLLIVTLRILWLLINTYVMILLQIIAAPFQILLGAVSPVGFGTWLRGILSNLAVYPLVGVMFLLAFIFLRGAFVALLHGWQAGIAPEWLVDFMNNTITHLMPFNITEQLGRTAWDPPLTLGTGSDALLYVGASFVIITLIPNAAKMIKAVVQGQPFAYGTAIGEAFAPMRYPAAYQLSSIAEGRFPGVYNFLSPAFRERITGYLESDRIGARVIREAATSGARALSEGRLPEK